MANKKDKIEEFFQTGCTVLDCALGGGYPLGIINIIGDKSSGKTLLAVELIAKARNSLGSKLKWYYDDAERGFTFNTQKMYRDESFILIPKKQKCSHTVEDFSKNFTNQVNKLKENEYLIYVLDCLDSLTSEAEIKRLEKAEKDREKGKEPEGSYKTEKATAMGEFFRLKKLEIGDKNISLVIISQVRKKIGVVFGERQYRAGGDALNFYAYVMMWLAEAEKHTKKDRVYGVTIKAYLKKLKTGLPFRKCFVDIIFDYGVDDLQTNIKYLYNLKTDGGKDKKEKIKFGGKEYNIDGFIKFVEENNMEERLREEVIDKWNAVEKSISSEGRKNKYGN